MSAGEVLLLASEASPAPWDSLPRITLLPVAKTVSLKNHQSRRKAQARRIADWRFPFKKSFHPVCTYDSRRLVTTQLRNCEPEDLDEEDELRTYDYFEALSCSCQVCDSTWTSCEGFRHP
ncbi:hypothetical protein IscW_ISCW010926 [Ixodes scapularis]|uniref:Uncharacterized protein n=1 Tax=Ixodes scapularis TaxID=6945 RepID=B7Q5E3_IXOSC|nr:hypothetical protein IscW_ISCW010926 [Ixodes scapularis]|eukprot:XP_002401858.1 hypothetical protein IscW_ISCW010926 [Ixodes scapularis]